MKKIIFIAVLLIACSASELSTKEKASMKEDISGFTMNEMSDADISYGKIGNFYYVTQNSDINEVGGGSNFRGEYLLYEKDEILKHHAISCVDPQKNIELITRYYNRYKTDTTLVSDIVFFKDSIRIKIDRQLDSISYIGWKVAVYKNGAATNHEKIRETILNPDTVFRNNKLR